MAEEQSEKNAVELQTARRNGKFHCKVLATLAMAGLTTLSYARSDTGNHAGPSGPHVQTGAPPSASSHPATTHIPAASGPHGTGTVRGGGTAQGHPGGARTQLNTGGGRIAHPLTGSHRILETTRTTSGGGTLHAVRYGSGLTGVVERPTKSGYMSRTYVQGGRVLYARVYRQNTFQRFGRAYSYESLVPAVAFGAAYYSWAASPWPAPVRYHWGWNAEPWHAAYGDSFTPYSRYSSLDEWITDYVISQNLRNAYDAQQADNVTESESVVGQAAPAAVATPARASGDKPSWDSSESAQQPYWQSPDDGQRPYWEESSSDAAPAKPKHSKPLNSVPNSSKGSQNGPLVDTSPPPLPSEIKAELNAQIKQKLRERQNQATTADTEALPESLKPGHTLFRVNAPLQVPADAAGRFCSLSANDYIERTGEMDENGTVPVQVKLGNASDCGSNLVTRVSVNDLEAMESEQQQELTDAMLAASKNMGAHGLPQAPGTTPMLLAAGQTRPAPDATRTLSQLQ